LNVLPLAFRRDFADDMLRDFEDGRSEALESGRRAAVWLFRGRMLGDVLRALAAQWVRTGWPAIGVLAMMLTFGSTSALATVWRQMDLQLPSDSPDEDVIALVMLAVVVVLFIIATILLTLWSERLVRRSTRRRV
jgi:threonine/homoserine/homoserine lactone efflux protein